MRRLDLRFVDVIFSFQMGKVKAYGQIDSNLLFGSMGRTFRALPPVGTGALGLLRWVLQSIELLVGQGTLVPVFAVNKSKMS